MDAALEGPKKGTEGIIADRSVVLSESHTIHIPTIIPSVPFSARPLFCVKLKILAIHEAKYALVG
jgi:hypothetical protein